MPALTFKPYDSSDVLKTHEDAFVDIQAQQLGQVAFQMMMDVLNDEHTKPKRFAHEFIPHVLVDH